MSGTLDKADKGLAGFSPVSQLWNIQPQGPMPYTTIDLLKHWAWMISLIKFCAHLFSLPIMVFMRRNLGWRYIDELHIAASFILWQVIGMFTSVTSGVVSEIGSPWIMVWAWLFLPMALYRRYHAKKATLALASYSYYPGTPLLAARLTGLAGTVFKMIDRDLEERASRFRLPRVVTHPAEAVNAGVVESFVRRFIEPCVVVLVALLCGAIGMGWGFAAFLVWTSILLHLDETLAQRAAFELFVDLVDGQVIAMERQHVLSGDHTAGEEAVSIARMANVGGIAARLHAEPSATPTAEEPS